VNYGPVCHYLIYQKLPAKGKSANCQSAAGKLKSEVSIVVTGVKRCSRSSL